MRVKTGILGGTFDPPHIGHLILAQEAGEALGLDRVIFIPAAQTPLKEGAPVAPAAARLAMVGAAVAQHGPSWEVSDWEIRRGGISYSVHTAEYFHGRFPDAELFWIIGADQLARLATWFRIGELAKLVSFAVAHRAESPPPERPQGLDAGVRLLELPVRRVDISSTEIRARLSRGAPVDLFLPEAVSRLIERERFYR